MVLLLGSYIPFLIMTFHPSDKELRDNFVYRIKNGFYRDSYRMLSEKDKKQISETEWKNTSQKIIPELAKTIKENNLWRISLDKP